MLLGFYLFLIGAYSLAIIQVPSYRILFIYDDHFTFGINDEFENSYII